jgi:hypothetical protein
MSWVSDLSSNQLNATYIEGFLDISGGNVTVRDSSHKLSMGTGNMSVSGTTTIVQPYTCITDVSLNNRLIVIGDVSMGDASFNIMNNLAINGTLSAGSYADGSIALSSIYTQFATDISYNGQKLQMNGDVSLNGTTQFSATTTLNIKNKIQFGDGTFISTTNKEANGTTFKASTFRNMTVTGDFKSDPTPPVASDYRIKTNVQTLDETHVLDNLRPVTYYQTQLARQDIGFLAHELQQYYPELVDGEKDGEEMQSVDYSGVLPVLINEIQQLKSKIESIRANRRS